MCLRRFVLLFIYMCASCCVTFYGPAHAADLEVSAQIEGIDDKPLRRELLSFSTIGSGDQRFSAIAAIRRTAKQDANLIREVLVSKGYYDARVETSLQRSPGKAVVIFRAETGPKFTISGYEIRYVDDIATDRPKDLQAFDVAPPEHPTGEDLQQIQQRLLVKLWNDGFPLAKSEGLNIEADFSNQTSIAVFSLRTGPIAVLGDLRVSGNERTKPSYFEAQRTFNSGTLYKREEINLYRDRLIDSGLFSNVQIDPSAPNDKGDTDLLVEVTERKHRTVSFGLNFGTDVGPGANAKWQNRNLLGNAETLTAEIEASQPEQTFELTFNKPTPKWPGAWQLSFLYEHEDTDAYLSDTIKLGGGVQKNYMRDNLELSAQLLYQLSDIQNSDGTEETFSSASIPLAATFNNEDSPLNPTRGHRLKLSVTPYIGDQQFNRVTLGGATRIGFGKNKKLLLAARGLVAATYGASRDDIPATERLFSGGGGSVRGYAYQEVGPIDDDNSPLGGSSLVEANIEARYALTDKIQVATFIDGGSVFDSETPDFSEDMLYGAGLGVRYLTAVGPIRLDVAFPVTPRTVTAPGIVTVDNPAPADQTVFEDQPVHFYIGIGQPF